MALHFSLRVNREPVGRFIAQRRDREIPADRVCTYDITVIYDDVEQRAVVQHNYDDGPFALVAAGIQATAGEAKMAEMTGDDR